MSVIKSDIILIGAGVMSATLGTIVKELAPDMKITVFEKLKGAGEESSNEWNNAGTGHAALCELNYTSEKADGSLDISKAVKVNEHFQLSRQFWSYLVEKKIIDNPKEFIMPIPHISMVQGEKNGLFLKRRMEALSENPLFADMEISDDPAVLKEWMPLIMDGRKAEEEPITATKCETGTDVNFGSLTRTLFDHLDAEDVDVRYEHMVKDLNQGSDGTWKLKVKDLKTNRVEQHEAKFIFIGAGGGSLPLLQKTGIRESRQIGGFPVSGLFLVCNNPEVVEQHHAKVYGKAKVGAPPMSVPHLDTRYINGKKSLLFGPFAGFTPKFLKTGSYFDLIGSVKPNNLLTMLGAGVKEMGLTRYLIQQVLLSNEKRMNDLREFIPNAKNEDWEMITAGQRVQVIKDTEAGGRGTLQFGTEVVTSQDGTVAALLGASPGASTAVHVMMEILTKCFPDRIKEWEPKVKEMVPSYGKQLSEHPALFQDILKKTAHTLMLENPIHEPSDIRQLS